MVVDEPSMVALDRRTDKVLAIGKSAREMDGKYMIIFVPFVHCEKVLLPTFMLLNK